MNKNCDTELAIARLTETSLRIATTDLGYIPSNSYGSGYGNRLGNGSGSVTSIGCGRGYGYCCGNGDGEP